MIIDNYINKFIDETLLAEDRARNEDHKSSGKLSASMLYQPLRFQVLKTIGAPRRPIDSYTLGKFKRGRDVEDWYVGQLENAGVLVERQKQVEYRGTIGYIDALVDSDKMLFKKGVMPHEVKSATNAKLKRIASTEVDWHYKMQGCLYALALGSEFYAIDIVSAEDLRPTVYIFDTLALKPEVDHIITMYDQAMTNWREKKILPAFAVNEKCKWAGIPDYAMFEEFYMTAPDTEVIAKLKELELV